MTIYTHYANTDDHYVTCSDADYADARSGAGTKVNGDGTIHLIGQEELNGEVPSDYRCHEAFLSFDTSATPTGTGDNSASITINVTANAGTNTAEWRDYDWAGGTGDWVAGASLSALTSRGSLSIPATGTRTIEATALPIPRQSRYEVIFFTSKLKDGTAQALGTSSRVTFNSADATGTTNDPYLTIDAATGIEGILSGTLGALTSTATGTLPAVGTGTVTLGALTTTAAAVINIAGTGSPTLDPLTSTAAGLLPIAAGGSPTLGELTSTGAGELPLVAELTATLGALTGTLQGDLADGNGGLVQTLGELTGTGTGLLQIEGAGAITFDPLTSTAAGELPLVGAATVNLEPLTGEMAAALLLVGLLSGTLDGVSSTATAAIVIAATGDGNLAALTLIAAGEQFVFAITPAARIAAIRGDRLTDRTAEVH